MSITNTAEGQLTVTATAPSHPVLAATQFVDVLIDVDRNPNTGGFGLGADYAFEIGASGATTFVRLTGDQANANTGRRTLTASYVNGRLTFSINRSELGSPAALGVLVFGGAVDASGENLAGLDRAPDNGFFQYELQLPAPKVGLTADAPIPVPGRPVAGRPFSVALAVTRGDTGGPLTGGGAVTCTVKLGTKAVAARGRYAGGLARCALRVPGASGGKILRGTITVRFRGTTVSRTFAYRVLAG